MKKKEIKALYLHIPFCNHICSYCDFCKMYYNKEIVDKYLLALEKEVIKDYKGEVIDTIYIGGGTPSSLNKEELIKLFDILKNVDTSPYLEFTFEVNVSDITIELLELLKKNKVNRISIGIQTINDKFLKLIDRCHTREEVYDKVNLTKKYFDNINVDFMYGFSMETLEDLKLDLDFFKELNVIHISIYSLILEPNTKLFINNTPSLDEEVESNMYFYIIDYLKDLGFIHYETSNFAKKGYESRHNLTYWNNNCYYGFGLGASGYVGDIRYTNTRSINNYIKGMYRLEEEKITREIEMENEMILGLRKLEGVSKISFYDKFGIEIDKVFDITDLLENKLLIEEDDRLFIAHDKLYLSNSILVSFIKNS